MPALPRAVLVAQIAGRQVTGLEFALVIVGAVLFDLALTLVLAAALGRRPSDRRAVREWEDRRAALARQLPAQRKTVRR